MRLSSLALLALLATTPALSLETPQLLDPAEAAALLAGADASPYEGADRLVLFERSVIEVEDSGLSHRHQHRFVKVLEPAGALAMRAMRFDYDPSSNMVEIRGLRVHRADSSFVDVDPSAAVDVTQPRGLILWGARMKVLALPSLEPGDGVEILSYTKGFLIAYLDEPAAGGERAVGAGEGVATTEGAGAGEGVATTEGAGADEGVATAEGASEDEERFIPPMRGHFYDSVLFQGDLPMLETSYTVALPRDKPLQYSQFNGEVMSSLRFEPDALVYRFWKSDVPAVEHEARMPDLSDVVPKVVMATVEDWEAKSRWFFETNDWVFESTPEIDEKVAEITSGLSEDEKIAALLHWVAQNIRYFGLTMGKGEGYTIHPSVMTFSDRCGVCKDIAGMLVTMLRSAGFETYAATTMAGSRVEDIPADQFNHCVVALRKQDGEYLMLDPTWAPWNRPLWSRWEGEQHYVIGSPWGEDLTHIRSFGPEENLLAVESEAELSEDGTLVGSFRLEGSGISDSRLRNISASRAKRDVRAYLERWLGALSDKVELTEYLFSDHRDFSRDTTLRFVYRIPDFAERCEDDLVFRSPALTLLAHNRSLSRLAVIPDGEERQHDLFIWAGQLVSIDETITLPRGFKAEAPEATELDETQAAVHFTWQEQGRKLSLAGEMQVNRRTIPAEDFPGLRSVADAIEEQAEALLYAVK